MRHSRRQVDAARRDGLRPSALGHLITPEVRRQAELVAPTPENVVLNHAGHLGTDLERCEELPACPSVLGYARARSISDADLGGAECGVNDEIDERGGVSLQLAY
jgi:hypothetical protein